MITSKVEHYWSVRKKQTETTALHIGRLHSKSNVTEMHTQHNAQTIIIYNIGLLINPTVIVPPRDSVRRHLIRNLIILFYILYIHSARWHDGRLILLSLLVLCDGFDNRIIILLVITNTYMCIHALLYDHFHILYIRQQRQMNCNLNRVFFVCNCKTKLDSLITLLIIVISVMHL